jgi:hypothetical protein
MSVLFLINNTGINTSKIIMNNFIAYMFNSMNLINNANEKFGKVFVCHQLLNIWVSANIFCLSFLKSVHNHVLFPLLTNAVWTNEVLPNAQTAESLFKQSLLKNYIIITDISTIWMTDWNQLFRIQFNAWLLLLQ